MIDLVTVQYLEIDSEHCNGKQNHFHENYVIVVEDAFSLGPDLMKSFSKYGLSDEEKIFNYRLFRARRGSENCLA